MAWKNGIDKLSNGNTKITESIRRIKRGGDTSNDISRKQSSSRESDRENIGNGRQQRGIDSTKTSENNGNNLKDSKQSSFSLSENNIKSNEEYDTNLSAEEKLDKYEEKKEQALKKIAEKAGVGYSFFDANKGETQQDMFYFLKGQESLKNQFAKENNINLDGRTFKEKYDLIEGNPEFEKFINKITDEYFKISRPKITDEELMEIAQDIHGTTDDYSVGAYMTIDGQLLDFDYGGSRDDHRSLSVPGYNMDSFMKAGNIRMQPEGSGFEVAVEPTEAQYERLADYIDNYIDDDINVDIDGTNDGRTYPRGTDAEKIIDDIRYYFRNGEFPQKSQYADFRYSQSNGEWSKYLKENWDLMPNSKKTFAFPTNEQLQVMDNKKISESADALNLKEIKKPQKEETYKTNLERSSGLIEQKIKAIEEGKIKRDENAKRVSKEDIRKTIENSINQKLFTKHFREKAYGIYKPSTNTIRLAQRSDFETAIHELGHQIDIKQLDNLSRNADIKVKAELRMLCEKSFPGTYKEIRTQLEEGFAEATRNFIIDSKSFAADYPNTAYLIQNELEKSPQLNKLFNTLQEQIHDYINMTPKDRVLSNVSFEGEEQKPKLTKEYIKDKVIEWVWDDTIPLKRLVEKIAKTKNVKVDNLSPSENIAMSLKLAEGLGDATVSSLRNGYEENGVKQTKGFSEILKDFDHNDIEDLVA